MNEITREQDEHFMRLAIQQVEEAKKVDGGIIGCVIVKDGEVIAVGFNMEVIENDPTAHAEIVTLRKLGQKLKQRHFDGCTLYSTLQPCGMCTIASIWAHIGRIVYGAERKDVNKKYFDEKHLNTTDFINDAFRDNIQVTTGVLEKECREIYL